VSGVTFSNASAQRGLKSWTPLIWVLLAAAVSLFLVRTVIPATSVLTSGFLACYVGGQMVKNREPGDHLYDEKLFLARSAQVSGGQARDVYSPDPPPLAVACLPLAYLQPTNARYAWIWVNVLILGLAIALIATQFSRPPQLLTITLLTALFTLAAPARDQFFQGQLYGLLLLLHVVGWRAYIRRRDALAGAALGLAMVLKVSGWPIGLLMIAQRRWTAVGWAAIAALGVAIITLPWVGVDAWRAEFLSGIPKVLGSSAATLTAYQDTAGFWQHWFRYDAQLNPSPLIDAPWLATILTLATTGIACIALVVRKCPTYASFGAAVALIELLSPAAEQYHYTVLLLPLAILWRDAWLYRSKVALGAAVVATFLIGWPIHYKAPHSAWAFLLSYPRYFGGWILFVTLLMTGRSRDEIADKGILASPRSGSSASADSRPNPWFSKQRIGQCRGSAAHAANCRD
jgi:hypothetical protein